LVGMDAWSRFQNYKRIKDLLFEHGFSTRIAKHYSGSLCQRIAVRTAAKELGMEAPLTQYYKTLGIKWYHIIPYFMIRDPFFMFKHYFWARTFLESYYAAKVDYRGDGGSKAFYVFQKS